MRFGLDNAYFKLRFRHYLPFGFINQLVCFFGSQPDQKEFWRNQLVFTFQQKAKVLIELDFCLTEIRLHLAFAPELSNEEKQRIPRYLFYVLLTLYWDKGTPLPYHNFPPQMRMMEEAKDHDPPIKTGKSTYAYSMYEELFATKQPMEDFLYVALSDNVYVNFSTLQAKDPAKDRSIISYVEVEEQAEKPKKEETAQEESEVASEKQSKNTKGEEPKHLKKKFVTGREVPLAPYNIFTNKTFKAMTRIFISYSKSDKKLVDEFLNHLSALKRDKLVETWHCTELLAGGKWDKEIQEHFDKADMICFMVSPNFMATKYIQEHELKKAIVRKQNDPNFKIVPIILDYCIWETKEYNLADYTALPYTAKPVMAFDNRNEAWYIIAECLRLSINDGTYPKGDDSFKSREDIPKRVKEIFLRINDRNSGN